MSSPSNFIDRHLTVTGISQTIPVQVTYVLDDPQNTVVNGDRVRATRFTSSPASDATGMYPLNNQLFVAQNCTPTTFDLYDIQGNAVDGRNFPALTGLGSPQMTVTGPDLFVQNIAQPVPEI